MGLAKKGKGKALCPNEGKREGKITMGRMEMGHKQVDEKFERSPLIEILVMGPKTIGGLFIKAKHNNPSENTRKKQENDKAKGLEEKIIDHLLSTLTSRGKKNRVFIQSTTNGIMLKHKLVEKEELDNVDTDGAIRSVEAAQ